MKKHIANTIAEIAASLIVASNYIWPDFKVQVWSLFQATDLDSVFNGFYIL